MDLIERLRLLEQDHEPDGWPAVRMRDITALLDVIEAARAEREVICAEAVKYADKSGRLEAKVDRLAAMLSLADALLRDHEQEVGDE